MDAFRRRLHVGDRALDGIVHRRAERRIGSKPPDRIDRRVFQADRTRQWDDVTGGKLEQCELVGHQPPATGDQSGTQGALARSGWPRKYERGAVSLYRRRMNNQILVAVAADAPVESPFQHRERLVGRKWQKRSRAIELE